MRDETKRTWNDGAPLTASEQGSLEQLLVDCNVFEEWPRSVLIIQ